VTGMTSCARTPAPKARPSAATAKDRAAMGVLFRRAGMFPPPGKYYNMARGGTVPSLEREEGL